MTRSREKGAVPRWIEALLGIDRAASFLHRGFELGRDEVLLGWTRPDLYMELTRREYARSEHYLPGGSTHACGLFPWEKAAISSPPFPSRGRILLGATGGGRELADLVGLGYRVVAFEPNDVLVKGAKQVASDLENVEVFQASYEDLVNAVHRGDGPLAGVVGGEPFDGVILGWGSLTHIVADQERRALLQALREMAPQAPVLASFYLRSQGKGATRAPGRSERFRAWVRPWLARVGAPHRPEEGVSFAPNGGFVYTFTTESLQRLAFECGYEVEKLDEWEFPHALLVPLAVAN